MSIQCIWKEEAPTSNEGGLLTYMCFVACFLRKGEGAPRRGQGVSLNEDFCLLVGARRTHFPPCKAPEKLRDVPSALRLFSKRQQNCAPGGEDFATSKLPTTSTIVIKLHQQVPVELADGKEEVGSLMVELADGKGGGGSAPQCVS